MIEEMYKELILEEWKYPKNKGMLVDFDREAHKNNPLCGDMLLIRMKFKNGVIDQVSFDGEGCAISLASASLMTEAIKNMPKEEVLRLDSSAVFSLLGVEITASRQKCALLSLEAIHHALL